MLRSVTQASDSAANFGKLSNFRCPLSAIRAITIGRDIWRGVDPPRRVANCVGGAPAPDDRRDAADSPTSE